MVGTIPRSSRWRLDKGLLIDGNHRAPYGRTAGCRNAGALIFVAGAEDRAPSEASPKAAQPRRPQRRTPQPPAKDITIRMMAMTTPLWRAWAVTVGMREPRHSRMSANQKPMEP